MIIILKFIMLLYPPIYNNTQKNNNYCVDYNTKYKFDEDIKK